MNFASFDLLFQPRVLVKQIDLLGVTWQTTDVHRLMSCLSMTYLDQLVVDDECQLISSLPHASPSSLIMVDDVQIYMSLPINTLISLISHMEVNKLNFWSGCQVLDMDVNTTPPPQVSHFVSQASLHSINTSIYCYLLLNHSRA